MLSVTSARAAGTLITAVTFPFVVRRLGVDLYGLWSYVVAVCAFTGLVANPGLTNYAAQQVAARRADAFDIVSDVLVLRFLASLVAVLAVLAVASFETRPDVRFLLRFYGVTFALATSVSLDYILPSLEMFHAQSFLVVAQQILYAIGIFSLVRSPKDVVWVAVSIVGSSFLTVPVAWVLLWRQGFRFRFSIAPQRWRGIIVPSFHYAASSVMSTIYHRSGHLAVRWYLGEHALGLYAAVTRLADVLRTFLASAQGVLMPRMALKESSGDRLPRLTRLAASIAVWFGVPLTVGGIVTAPVLVPWVLGAQFQDAVRAFQWVIPYVLTAASAMLFAGTILYALGRHRAYLVSTVVGGITAIALNLILPPVFGVAGACTAFVLGELGVGLCAFILCPPTVRGAAKTPLFGPAILASTIMGLALALALPRHLPLLVLVALGCAVYGMIWMVFGRHLLKKEFQAFA